MRWSTRYSSTEIGAAAVRKALHACAKTDARLAGVVAGVIAASAAVGGTLLKMAFDGMSPAVSSWLSGVVLGSRLVMSAEYGAAAVTTMPAFCIAR